MDAALLSGSALAALDDAGRAEYWASLALRHARNLGARSIRRLIGRFGSALEAVRRPSDWGEATVNASRSADIVNDAWRAAARPEWDAARTLPGRIILWTDPLYPSLLRELPDAPLLLYARGNLELLRGPCLAVVGKRQCSSEGIRAASYFASNLAGAGVTVVSGLARGVDQAAHQAAIDRPGSTIAVLGTGIDVPYPATNTELHARIGAEGLLVSEFAPGTPPAPGNFPIRNRIISGLCLGVLVVEAAPRSGSLITARLALEQNRAVFAVPGALGAPTAQGCQELIRQGAKPVFAAHDVLLDLFPHLKDAAGQVSPPDAPGTPGASGTSNKSGTPRQAATAAAAPVPGAPTAPAARPSRPPAACPPDSPEGRLLALLEREGGAVSIDLLDDTLALPAAALSTLLVRLEMAGHIRRLPGQYYALTEAADAPY